jgi:hypothetical protein
VSMDEYPLPPGQKAGGVATRAVKRHERCSRRSRELGPPRRGVASGYHRIDDRAPELPRPQTPALGLRVAPLRASAVLCGADDRGAVEV